MKWFDDYFETKEQIRFLELKIEKLSLLEQERAFLTNQLQDLQAYADKLEKVASSFKGIENEIIKRKYLKGQTIREIASDLNLSESYISKKHAYIQRVLKFAER